MKRSAIKNQLLSINNFEDLTCEISFHNFLNQTKGIIYIQNYELNDKFKESLEYKQPCIRVVVEARFSKPRNTNTTAVLLTFNLTKTPDTGTVPEEGVSKVSNFRAGAGGGDGAVAQVENFS